MSEIRTEELFARFTLNRTLVSDRNGKKNFQPVNGKEILERLAAIRIHRWNYKCESDTDVPHIGPMAQDFKAAFYPRP